MEFNLPKILYAGKEVEAIVEGGKGINVSTGLTAGRFANAGAIGTFSGVNPDSVDEGGNSIKRIFKGRTRQEKQKEMIEYSIKGALTQAKIAHEESNGNGRILMNVLWEMGACPEILEGVLSKANGIIHGVTCGAGMPYKLSEIASKYKTFYNPIVSSVRAFKILWKRAYEKNKEWLGAVVYEDPWVAGGHNGLTNAEDPKKPQRAYERLVELREFMNQVGLNETPIIIAGGVWCLSEWAFAINNPEIGAVAFQFGTRPLVTKESPISDEHKKVLLNAKEGDVSLQRFSPTGFYSSAIRNDFLKMLENRSARQIKFAMEKTDELLEEITLNNQSVFVSKESIAKINNFIKDGFETAMKTPDSTMIFVGDEEAKKIRTGLKDCIGCLSVCQFSGWSQYEGVNVKADPRSFCIQKTLWDVSHGENPNKNLVFAGKDVFYFGKDPLYKDGNVPTIKELVETIKLGK